MGLNLRRPEMPRIFHRRHDRQACGDPLQAHQDELARINLERAMGTLEVENDGSWRVRRAATAATEGKKP